jgi:effector-binding domain-containing protein
MAKKIIGVFLGLLLILVLIGVLQPSERVIEGEYLIMEPADRLVEKLNDDLKMARWMAEASGKRIQTVEQERSRGRGFGLLKSPEPSIPDISASMEVDLYRPVRHDVSTNFYVQNTSEGTKINTFSTISVSGTGRFVSWLFGLSNRWSSLLDETMEVIRAESESDFIALVDGYYIERRDVIERNYLLVRQRVPFGDMNAFSKDHFPRLDVFAQQHQLRRFPFSTFYYHLDHENEMADIAAAVQIDRDLQTPPENLDVKFMRRGKVVFARHYGPLEEVVDGHRAIRQYLEENNLHYDPPFIETYEVGARDVNNPDDFVTLVEYYLIAD